MFVCKAFTSMVTKNEFSGILKILILFTKSLVPLIFGGISFTGGWKWWSKQHEILEFWQLIELMAGLPGSIGR